MTDQPPADPNRYARLGPLGQAFVDDHDAIALAELLVKAHDDLERGRARIVTLEHVAAGNKRHVQLIVPDLERAQAEIDRLTAELADYDERAEEEKQRADEAEQHLRNIAQGGPHADAVQAEIGEMIRQTHELREQLRRAEARPGVVHNDWPAGNRWLHVVFTSPDETTANTSALNLRDHLAAEFPGVGMRISSNAVEGTPDPDIPSDKNGPTIENSQASSGDPVDNPADNKGAPRDYRTRIARAIHRYDNHHALSGNDIPSKHHRGEAEAVLTELGRELAALAEYENATTWMTDCLNCARVTSSGYAEMVRAEKAEAATTRVTALYEQWVKAGPPPLGVPTSRWWDRRLVELRAAIHGPTEQPAPRDPCPHCEASSDRVRRDRMRQHIAEQHPEVRAGA